MTAGGCVEEQDSALAGFFLAQEEHLHFRKCAKINAVLDGVLNSEHAGTSRLGNGGDFQDVLLLHCELLERRNKEIYAVVASGAHLDTKGDPASGVPQIETPRIVIATNTVSVDNEHSGCKVTLTKIDSIGACRHNLVPCPHLRYRSTTARAPFNEHVRSYFRYLRAVHCAPDEKTRQATTYRLREFIFTSCYPKMIARFGEGSKKGCNIWQILTQPPPLLPKHARDIPIPGELATKRLSECQAGVIRNLVNDPASVDSGIFIYRSHDNRLRFHHLLCSTLRSAKRELLQLELGTTAQTISNACSFMVNLSNFLSVFEEFLGPHLEWLAECANIRDVNDVPTWTAPLPGRTRPIIPHLSAKDRGRIQRSLDDQGNGVEAKATSEPDSDAGDEDDDERAQVQESAKQKRPTSPYKVWAATAKIYLESICTHETNLRNLVHASSPGLKGLRNLELAFIMQAEVAVVDLQTHRNAKLRKDSLIGTPETAKESSSEERELPIDEAFITKNLKPHRPSLHARQLSEQLKGHSSGRRPSITGESVLMSLITMARDPKLMALIDDTLLERNKICATKADLLNFLKLRSPFYWVLMSKKDREIGDSTGATSSDLIDLLACSDTAVPVYMPRSLGLPVLNKVKRETAGRLQDWQNKSANSDASGSW